MVSLNNIIGQMIEISQRKKQATSRVSLFQTGDGVGIMATCFSDWLKFANPGKQFIFPFVCRYKT